MVPFHLRYTLSRRQRFPELLPWLPALAGSLGYAIGVTVLAVDVSPAFLALLLLPLIFYRGLFALLFDLTLRAAKPVELLVDETTLEMRWDGKRLKLPLNGIIQVFLADSVWTVLHLNGSALSLPSQAIDAEQIGYLKSFAQIAAAERKAASER